MIDHLTYYDSRTTVTDFTIRKENIFVAEGSMLASGLIENIAQTCAARLGYYNLISGLPVKIGFIGAISNLHISRVPAIGEKIETTINVIEEVMGMTLVHSKTCAGDEILATAEMKIAIK